MPSGFLGGCDHRSGGSPETGKRPHDADCPKQMLSDHDLEKQCETDQKPRPVLIGINQWQRVLPFFLNCHNQHSAKQIRKVQLQEGDRATQDPLFGCGCRPG
jgi:hypothetical protein